MQGPRDSRFGVRRCLLMEEERRRLAFMVGAAGRRS